MKKLQFSLRTLMTAVISLGVAQTFYFEPSTAYNQNNKTAERIIETSESEVVKSPADFSTRIKQIERLKDCLNHPKDLTNIIAKTRFSTADIDGGQKTAEKLNDYKRKISCNFLNQSGYALELKEIEKIFSTLFLREFKEI